MIPDDAIDGYLSAIFGDSEPGAMLHTMLLAVAEPETGPLGLPKIATTLYAIDPSGPNGGDPFVAKAIRAAVAEKLREGCVIEFAGLAIEAHIVDIPDNDEVAENKARVMHGDRRLSEHPAAVETTVLFAACRDGRRWTGMHYLTGPKAGTVLGPELHQGTLVDQEQGRYARLIRSAVGIYR